MISQTAEYALRAVVHLANRPNPGPASALEISEAVRVPVGYLQKILRMLARAEILTAQRGSGGGFSLAKVATAISVLDVLKASESPPERISRCPLGIKGHTKLCTLHRLLDDQLAHAEQVFARTSIADLINPASEVRPLCDPAAQARVSLRVEPGLGVRPAGAMGDEEK
jgi:Rrf2 family nitric oxide-sensitive transcriptional repressor